MPEHCNPLHFKSSVFCVLCHKGLPEPQYESNHELLQGKAWEYKVLGLCNIANSNDRVLVVAVPADLTAPSTLSELRVIQKGRSLTIQFCLKSECRTCKEGQTAYFIHQSCWQWIRQFNEHYTALSIYELARSTYPIYELEDTADGESNLAIDFSNLINRTRIDTGIGRGLRIFSRLPAEIRSMISADLERNLSSYLLAGSKTSYRLLNIIGRPCSSSDVIELECSTVVKTVYVETISVWGSSYISSLLFNNAKGISIIKPESEIKGVRFIVGPYGLRALSILYTDNSTSAWLGDSRNGWIGVIYGSEISRLRILKDNLKYLRIDISNVDARSVPESRVMWDKDVPSTQSHRILEMICTHGQIKHFPEWRLCRYLPLCNKEYISGLTMYCRGHSIIGMAASFKQSRKLVGSCHGCPIHFCLRPKERIISVWLRMPVNHFNIESDPSVLVVTNFKRSCIFGPSLSLSTIQERQYAWTRLNKESSPDIIGIFYDALSRRPLDKIANIGISQDIDLGYSLVNPEPPTIPVPWRRPRILGNEVTGLFLSIGTLSHVQSIKVRTVGPRFMGVLVIHHDRSIDVLGQWDNCQTSEIYNSSDGILTSLTFRFCGESRASYVDGIFVGVGDVNTAQDLDLGTFKIFSIKKLISPAISWWFSELYDCIEPWIGDYQEVNVSPEIYKIIDMR